MERDKDFRRYPGKTDSYLGIISVYNKWELEKEKEKTARWEGVACQERPKCFQDKMS